jgi:adenylate cyclase
MVSGTDASDLTGQPPDRRRLIVVVHADVVGYSRLIGLDDVGTLNRMRRLRREVIDPAITAHGGRIVNTGGDALLIVFDSVDGAVRSALRVQEQVPVVNGEIHPDRAIRFRIGINVGDVIPDGTDVHGDVVNVAARLQAECSPGGICVSRAVRDHMHGRLDIAFEALGSLNLKNIARPVEAFVLRIAATTATLHSAARSFGYGETETLPLPGKPSIAVLPFANLSGDCGQDYFADGMTEEIITALSRIPSFLVISRHSTFAYKEKSPDIRQVGRELEVRYVLEGSVRKSSERMRITGQLIDAASGVHLWADRFDVPVADIFDVQDRITASVVGAIEPMVRQAEIERARRKPANNLEAYDLLLRSRFNYGQQTRDALEESCQLLQRAIELDPNYPLALALLARAQSNIDAQHFRFPTAADVDRYVRIAQRAVELGRDDPEVLINASVVIGQAGGDLGEAAALVDRALALNPNSAEAWATSGILHAYRGEGEAALEHLDRSVRLCPMNLWVMGQYTAYARAHFVAGRYEDALHWIERGQRRYPDHVIFVREKAAALGLLGRTDEARHVVMHLRALVPDLTISRLRDVGAILYKHANSRSAVGAALLEGLRRAGLPE